MTKQTQSPLRASHRYHRVERLVAQALKNLTTLGNFANFANRSGAFTHCRLVLPAQGNVHICIADSYEQIKEYRRKLRASPMSLNISGAYPRCGDLQGFIELYAFTGMYLVTFYSEDDRATDVKAVRSHKILFNPVHNAVPNPRTSTLPITTATHLAAIELGLRVEDIDSNLICYCVDADKGLWEYQIKEGANPSRLSPNRKGVVVNVPTHLDPFWRDRVNVQAIGIGSDLEQAYNFRVRRLKAEAVSLYTPDLYAIIPEVGLKLQLRSSAGADPLPDVKVIAQTLRLMHLRGTFEVLFVDGDAQTVIATETMKFP